VNKGWTIYSYARGECPAAFVTTSSSIPGGSNGSLGCDQHHQALSTVLSGVKPSFVIVTDSELSLKQMKGGGTGSAAGARYQSGLEETLRLASGTARVVVTLSPPPIGQSLLNCDTAGSTPSSCVGRISPDWETMSTIDKAAATVTHTRYLNTSAWFCIDGQCPAFVGSTPVMYDGVHMTKAYGLSLAPSITSALGI
jgi:hypothetical protein